MRYMLVAPHKNGRDTTIMEITDDAYVVSVDTPQAYDALEAGNTDFFMNAPDNVVCSVTPVIESVEWQEPPCEVELTLEIVEEFMDRLERMNDPNDSLMETEFVLDGVKIKLV